MLQSKGRLKSAGKVRNFFIVRSANRVKTLFLKDNVLIEIWFLNKNWTQNLFFGNYFFSTKWLFKKFCFRNLTRREIVNSQSETLKKCHFKISFGRKKFIIIKSAGTKSSQFKTWPFGNFSFQIFIVQENVCFRIWFLFPKKFIWNSDFYWKTLRQNHAF